MYEDEYGDEMDYEEELPEDDEDNISEDEDEDLEDLEGSMGEIEGLPGDHDVDVEVIMEGDDEDDEDDEDDDDEDASDSDDSHDSDNEDDDAHLELLDEVAHVHELAHADDAGDWISDNDGDGDEYDERGADDDVLDLDDDLPAIGGIAGQIIRAVADGHPAEEAENMLQQMEEHMAEHQRDPISLLNEEYDEEMDEDGKIDESTSLQTNG